MVELDQDYVEKMEDVLALYEKPLSPEEPVVCVDEKSVSLHGEVREPMGMEPGRVARRDSEYERCGTANIFCGVEPKAGVHFQQVTQTRAAYELAGFLQGVAEAYPKAKTIHLVMDNLNTHRRKALLDRYGEQEGNTLWNRFTVHYTPKHGSWLNVAECELSCLTRQCLSDRRIAELAELQTEIAAWSDKTNAKQRGVDWQFRVEHARMKLKRLYPKIMT